MIRDGLSDAASGRHMGLCGEMCAEKYNFARDSISHPQDRRGGMRGGEVEVGSEKLEVRS